MCVSEGFLLSSAGGQRRDVRESRVKGWLLAVLR